MGISKTELFTKQQNQMAKWAKAIAHPARIAILELLCASPTCANGLFVEELGLAQATVSQHLKALKAAGLVQGTVEGVSISYCIHTENWRLAQHAMSSFYGQFDALEAKRCC